MEYKSLPIMVENMLLISKASKIPVIIQTGGKTIMGTPVLEESDLDEDGIKVAVDSYETLKEQHLEKNKDVYADTNGIATRQFVWLKNVEILSSKKVILPFMVVFIDKIEAISIGSVR